MVAHSSSLQQNKERGLTGLSRSYNGLRSNVLITTVITHLISLFQLLICLYAQLGLCFAEHPTRRIVLAPTSLGTGKLIPPGVNPLEADVGSFSRVADSVKKDKIDPLFVL